MATDSKQRGLFHVDAPVTVMVEQGSDVTSPQKVTVKGFVSVATKNDRSGDMVFPEEFRIKQFMAAPTMLVNHKFWHDNNGNAVSVGRPAALYVAKLAKSENADNWKVVDEATGKPVAEYPKAKVPNLGLGSRGLFMIAEVTEPRVAAMVQRGELQALSWKGMTTIEYKVAADNTIMRTMNDIDLYEISLVHVPDNPDSTFTVMKDAGHGDEILAVHIVKMEQSRFESLPMATEFLKGRGLAYDQMRIQDGMIYSMQCPSGDVELERMVAVKMADGVAMLAAPLKKAVMTNRRLTKEEVAKLGTIYSQPQAGEETPTTETEMTAAAATSPDAAAQAKTEEKKTEVVKTAAELNAELANLVATKTAESLTATLKPFTDAMTGMTASMGKLVEKMTPVTAEVKPEPKTETKTEDRTEVQKTAKGDEIVAGLKLQLEAVNTKLDGLLKSTPATPTREERIEAEKSAKEDPNDVFDNTFGFLGGSDGK